MMIKRQRTRRGRPIDSGLKGRREEEILDCAERLFARHGYVDTDTQLLTDTLGIGKGTLYRYFPSKAKLFHAVVNRGLNRLRSQVERDVATIADPLQRIEQAILSYLTHYASEPKLVELFLQELAHFKKRQKPAYFVHHDLHIGPWRELYRSMVKSGRVRELREMDESNVVNDLLYGTIIANYVTGRRVTPAEQAHAIIELVFNGILTDRERKKREEHTGDTLLRPSLHNTKVHWT